MVSFGWEETTAANLLVFHRYWSFEHALARIRIHCVVCVRCEELRVRMPELPACLAPRSVVAF